jgi:hypothetical protein
MALARSIRPLRQAALNGSDSRFMLAEIICQAGGLLQGKRGEEAKGNRQQAIEKGSVI